MENLTTQNNTQTQTAAPLPTSPTPAIHPLEGNNENGGGLILKTIIVALIVALGVATGYFGSKFKQSQSAKGTATTAGHVVLKTEKTEGSTDTRTFRDKAEGLLEKGGIDGEGTHKLVRDKKRPDQNVYLTSSVLDLNEYVGKKVRVWGETNAGQKAGWLMDVGKIELL